MIEGEASANIGNYNLPAIDVQEKRRNFNGYQVNQYFTMADVQQGDTSGTTDTDSVTDTDRKTGFASGYTKINQKRTKR